MTNCPIFQSLGKTVAGKRSDYNKCAECPFMQDCPQDILDDAMNKILKQVGEYVKAERKKSGIDKMGR